MSNDKYDESLPDLQAHFREYGYSRPTLFDHIDPAVTEEQATTAAKKVKEMMQQTGLRHIVSVMVIGERHHVGVMTDEHLNQQDAPPEYVDGVYVSISRVNSLDHWLGPKTAAPAPKGP